MRAWKFPWTKDGSVALAEAIRREDERQAAIPSVLDYKAAFVDAMHYLMRVDPEAVKRVSKDHAKVVAYLEKYGIGRRK